MQPNTGRSSETRIPWSREPDKVANILVFDIIKQTKNKENFVRQMKQLCFKIDFKIFLVLLLKGFKIKF